MKENTGIGQAQDRVYSIGGGSLYFGYDDGDGCPAPQGELPSDLDAQESVTGDPVILETMTVMELVEESRPAVPWFRRLWMFLNTDIVEIWKTLKGNIDAFRR